MTTLHKLKLKFSKFLIRFLYKTEGYWPKKMEDWIRSKTRSLRKKNERQETINELNQQINKDHKHIRWACAACGAFIKKIHKWPKAGSWIEDYCRNKHYNQVFVEDGGLVTFRATNIDIKNENKDLLRSSEKVVKLKPV